MDNAGREAQEMSVAEMLLFLVIHVMAIECDMLMMTKRGDDTDDLRRIY